MENNKIEIKIKDMTKESLKTIMPDLLSLENNWTGIGEIPWSAENFLFELPEKFNLSVYAFYEGRVVGYAIYSGKDKNTALLNKIVVDTNVRGKGIAVKLWERAILKCREKGFKDLELKVLPENEAAVKLYKKLGCVYYGTVVGTDNKVRCTVKYVFKQKESIKHSSPTIDEEDINSVVKAMKDGDIATGNIVKQFTKKVAEYIGCKHAIATNSGSAALHLALKSLGIKKGDEVIIPSYSCYSLLNAVIICDATPVLVDINQNDCNISLADAKRNITKNTKAMILPHMYGHPIEDIELFLELNIPIIEDCAVVIGAIHNGKKVGNFGKISVVSFYGTKMMTTGVGGIILTNDDTVFVRLKDLTQNDNRDTFGEGYNYKMSDLQASLGLSQLKKLNGFIKRRKEIATNYNQMLNNLSNLDPEFYLPQDELKENIFFRYIIRTKDCDEFIKNLSKRGVYSAKPVNKPLHSYLGLSDDKFPNTMNFINTAVSIPIYPILCDKQIEDICGIINNWRKESADLYE